MAKQESVRKNIFMNAILSVSSFIFPLISYPYVTRVLAPVGIGKVSFVNSIITYLANFAQLGIPYYGIRACAKVRDNRNKLAQTYQEIFIIGMVMCVLTYGLLAVLILCVPRIRADKDLFVLMSSIILFYSLGMDWLYKALEQYTYITIRSIIFKGIALLGMFLFVRNSDDYLVYGGLTIFAASASNIYNFIHLPKIVDTRLIGHYDLEQHIKPILVFFAMTCATTIYTHLDTAMLGFMTNDEICGYYSVATKIKLVLVSVITSLGAVLLPRVSYYMEKGMQDEFINIMKKTMNFIIVISFPMALFFVVFARESVLLISGAKFLGSVIPMQVITFTLPLIAMTNIMGIQILVPMGKEKWVLHSEIAGAFLDLVLNALLIPLLGATGAAVGTLVAEGVVWLVQYIYLKDIIIQAYREVRFMLIIVAVVFATVCSVWVKLLNLPAFLTLIIVSVLFFSVYFGILILRKEAISLEILQLTTMKVKKIFGKI